MPRLGDHYDIEIEVHSRPIMEYQTDEYFELNLPVAPAVMVVEEVVVEGKDVDEHELKCCICRHLGLPEPEKPKKSLMGRLFS